MQPPISPETGSRRQFHRPIPPRLAAVVEYLELFQPRIVTISDLEGYLRELGMDDPPANVARVLQKLGWLLPLRTRGRWEFAPGARAGALPSGDPFIELRATLQRRELPVVLAYDSAAWLQGLSARQPQTQVLATYPKRKLPIALSGFRITRIWGVLEPERKDNLPVWRVAVGGKRYGGIVLAEDPQAEALAPEELGLLRLLATQVSAAVAALRAEKYEQILRGMS